MDNTLLSHENPDILDTLFREAESLFHSYGLQIAPEKVQKQAPWNYLGQKLIETCIIPQKVHIHKDSLKTLNNFQKLLGDINWL